MNVLDIMAKSPAVCTPDTPLSEVARMMVDHDCGAIPVVESRETPRPVGVLTDRDIVVRLVAEGQNPLDRTAGDAMSDSVASVPSDASLEECTRVMEDNQIRRVIVVGEDGTVIGMVSQADIALNAAPQTVAGVLREVSEEEELNSERAPLGGAYSS